MRMEALIYELLSNVGANEKSSQKKTVVSLSSTLTTAQRLCSTIEEI